MEVGEGIVEYTKENTISSRDMDVVKSSFIFAVMHPKNLM